MDDKRLVERLARGGAAGFTGTLALQGLRMASQRWFPTTMPPIKEDPGAFMVEQVEQSLPAAMRERVPAIVETAASKSMAVGYGLTAGALYAALRPNSGHVVIEGVALGLGTWAVGYLGWLSRLGLMPPLREQGAVEVIAPAARHALFGVATVAAYRWLRHHV